jgi:hypothetical protein
LRHLGQTDLMTLISYFIAFPPIADPENQQPTP